MNAIAAVVCRGNGSQRFTGRPARAKTMAHERPIRPAPMTAILLMTWAPAGWRDDNPDAASCHVAAVAPRYREGGVVNGGRGRTQEERMSGNKSKVAVLDDWQGVAHQSADWYELESRADITI